MGLPCLILILGQITMTYILRFVRLCTVVSVHFYKLACYTCPPTTPGMCTVTLSLSNPVRFCASTSSSSSSLGSRCVPWLGEGLSMSSPNDPVLCCPLPYRVAPVFVHQQRAIYRGSLGVECSPAFWAGHYAVHGYSPVVVLCIVLK